jgi:AcrR family transcriptional regulator
MARTFTERARREQLVAVTLELVAEHGRKALSLQRIADAAGLSKAAVLYYFRTKDAVLAAAYESVRAELVTHVAAAVEAAPSAVAGIEAYLDTLLGLLASDPRRARLLAESLGEVTEDSPSTPRRWDALAALVEAAQREGDVRADADPRLTAIMLGGLVDAVVGASFEDAGIELGAARAQVLAFARAALR